MLCAKKQKNNEGKVTGGSIIDRDNQASFILIITETEKNPVICVYIRGTLNTKRKPWHAVLMHDRYNGAGPHRSLHALWQSCVSANSDDQ